MIDIELHIQILLQGRTCCLAVGGARRSQPLAVSYLEVGLSYREPPHPQDMPFTGQPASAE